MTDTHRGSCYCGAVAIEATGQPEGMGYCHCSACRSYTGTPVNAFTLWKPDNVKIRKGEEFLGRFKSSEMSIRRSCAKCGGNVMTDHPGLGLIDVFAGIIPTMPFRPGFHLNYEENRPPDEGWPSEIEGFPRRDRRLWRSGARNNSARPIWPDCCRNFLNPNPTPPASNQ